MIRPTMIKILDFSTLGHFTGRGVLFDHKIENTCSFARKDLADFSLHSKRLTLSFALPPILSLTAEKD